MYAGFFLVLLLLIAGVGLYILSTAPTSQDENPFTPVSILLITDNLPATRAFLEYYASQIAWMDSCILQCMLLVYPEHNPDVRALCEDMSREYDFFTACSVGRLHAMLDEMIGSG